MNGKTRPVRSSSWNGNRADVPSSGPPTHYRHNATPKRQSVWVRHYLQSDLNIHQFFTTTVILLQALQSFTLTVQAAEVFKWVDERGAVHYEDHPPTQASKKIVINNSQKSDAVYQSELEKQNKLLKVYSEEREEQQKQKAKVTAELAVWEVNCKLARQNLTGIQTASYLYEPTNDPFNPRILNQVDRNTEIAKAEAAVHQWCNE